MRRYLADLPLSHVLDEGWAGQRNGALLRLMVESGFTTLITVDRNLAYQQNVAAAGVSVIVLHAHGNRTDDLAPLVPALRVALSDAKQGEVRHLSGREDR